MPETHHYNDFLKIVLLALAGWFLYVVSDTMNKWLARAYPVSEVLMLTYTVGLAVIVPWIGFRHGWNSVIPPERWKWHMARACCGAVSGLTGVQSLHRIPMADFYGVVFLAPLTMCVLSHFFLKERVGRHRMTAAAVGFLGVIVLAGPQFASGSIGYIFAFTGMIFMSFSAISVRKIGREPILMLFAFYVFLGNFLLNAALMGLQGGFIIPRWSALPVFAAVPLVVLGGLLAYSISFSRVKETAMIAPFHYSQIIWGALLGFMLFHEVPTPRTILGSFIIIGSGLYMIWREHALHKASLLRLSER